jgi:glycosyltransferase involved in cell wall biosynthesis
VVSAAELARIIDEAPLLLFAHRDGPSARKTTLANALSRAKPVVATEGTQTWGRLVGDGAVRLVPADPLAVAEATCEILRDPAARSALGRRARAFHDRYQHPDRVVPQIVEFLEHVTGGERRREESAARPVSTSRC